MTFCQTLLRSAIVLYRKTVSPILPPACRFHPTCSRYAAEAVERHGAARGTLLALRRLSRCHPWHPGGFDPVPEVEDRQGAPAPRAAVPDKAAQRAATR